VITIKDQLDRHSKTQERRGKSLKKLRDSLKDLLPNSTRMNHAEGHNEKSVYTWEVMHTDVREHKTHSSLNQRRIYIESPRKQLLDSDMLIPEATQIREGYYPRSNRPSLMSSVPEVKPEELPYTPYFKPKSMRVSNMSMNSLHAPKPEYTMSALKQVMIDNTELDMSIDDYISEDSNINIDLQPAS